VSWFDVTFVTPDVQQRVEAAVDSLVDEMLDFLIALVRWPTVNPPGSEYRGCAEWLARSYSRFGYEVSLVEAEGMPEHTARYPRVNVLARRAQAGPTLHFNGHFDVVPPGDGWSVGPFEAHLLDGRLYGRGTADQKAGLAASLFAIEALRRAGFALNGTVEQSATVDEESGGFAGVGLLCRAGLITSPRTSYVIITEPLGYDRICLGHRGVYWFEVVARGRTAHGSMPSLGVNAADLMAELIGRLNRELKPKLAARATSMPMEPPPGRHPSLNLNSLHGGQLVDGLESPCVPDHCRAVFDRRFIAEESFCAVRTEIAELVASADGGAKRFELRDLMVVEPVQTTANCPLVHALEDAVENVLGRRPAHIASPGTYDQKHVVRLGGVRQCVAYGPGILELAHQPDEYVVVEHLVNSTKVMALAALSLVGSAGS
jgi:succinyl-diaminopimelate desuccinylase